MADEDRIKRCARRGCDTWQNMTRLPQDNWITVQVNGDRFDSVYNFCTLDCLMFWSAANSQPTEEYKP